MDPEAGQGMEGNDEAREALPDIFGIPVILNNILEHLSNSQLLEFSFVSKLWKKEARIVMKKRGNVVALLKCDGVSGCGKVFEDFAVNLETLNETLYSGMTIRFWPVDYCQGTGALEMERIHESILAGMRGKLKRFSIRLYNPESCWKNAQDCPSFHLLRLLLRDFITDLDHLTLKIEKTMEPFIQQYLPHGPYPKLKVLKLNDVYDDIEEETFGSLIRLLLSRAPNLQEIHTDGNVSLRENLVEGREGVVHVYETEVDNAMQDIWETAIPALRLKKMSLVCNTDPELELNRFNEKAQSLLRKCCATTLEYLHLDSMSSVLFMSYGIRLVNVKIFLIGFNFHELERIKSIMARFDFTYFLPNLTKVVILLDDCDYPYLPPNNMTAIYEQANDAAQKEPTVTRAGNIKYLDLTEYNSIPRSILQFFAHIFPAIEELEIQGRVEDISVGSAWDLWPYLTQMKVEEEWYQRP